MQHRWRNIGNRPGLFTCPDGQNVWFLIIYARNDERRADFYFIAITNKHCWKRKWLWSKSDS